MRIGIIGAGVMGEVITSSLVQKQAFRPRDLILSDLSRGALHALEQRFGVEVTPDNEAVAAAADVLVLSVKPQQAAEVAASIAGVLRPDATVVSIMAGVSVATLRRALGHDRLIRAMPNIPARIGEGMTAWIATPEVPDLVKVVARMIFQAFGREIEVREERLVDAATAVSGSGPAYVFYVAEAMIAGAVALGFESADAERLVQQTFRGAVDLWIASGEPPGRLRADVTSKGGTTQAALERLDGDRVAARFGDALRAAFDRAGALSKMADEGVG